METKMFKVGDWIKCVCEPNCTCRGKIVAITERDPVVEGVMTNNGEPVLVDDTLTRENVRLLTAEEIEQAKIDLVIATINEANGDNQ
jgi:hypothetical protein